MPKYRGMAMIDYLRTIFGEDILECEKDEPIQQGLDEIRRKHGLPVAEE